MLSDTPAGTRPVPLDPLSPGCQRSRLAGVLERSCRVAARLGVVKLDLDGERLIAEAKTSCSLGDFGGEEFREPLRRLLDSCEKEARLNSLGRMAVRHDVLQLLRNRLRITEERRMNPQIAERRIEQPLFITG